MRFLHRLGQGQPIIPLMQAVMRHHDLWNQDMARTLPEGSPHRETDDIILRSGNGRCADHIEMQTFPIAKNLALGLMQNLGGVQLGGIIISRLLPGAKIRPNIDQDGFFSRYHIVLQGFAGSLFTCGDETVCMTSGDVWWLDRAAECSAKNNSQDDAVHLLVDIRVEP